MLEFLSKLFGTKSQRDLKEVQPYLDAALAVYPQIHALTNDELRGKTLEFKKRIKDEVASEEADSKCEIFAGNGDLVLHGAEGQLLRICDIQGRTIVSGKAVDGKAYTMPSAGVYLIQVGNHKAQKVVVVR